MRESVFYASLRLSYYFSSFHDLQIKGIGSSKNVLRWLLITFLAISGSNAMIIFRCLVSCIIDAFLGVPRAESIHAPILVCGPHTTWWDAMTIVLAAHCPGGVSRIESARAPVLGRTYFALLCMFSLLSVSLYFLVCFQAISEALSF